jgi:hypothetical protein
MKKKTSKKAKATARRTRSAAKDLTAKRTGAVKAGTVIGATSKDPDALRIRRLPTVQSIPDGTSNTILL